MKIVKKIRFAFKNAVAEDWLQLASLILSLISLLCFLFVLIQIIN